MIQTLPITKARSELTKLVKNVSKKLDEYIITVKGVPSAVLMSSAEFESWKETNDILSDPELMEAINEGEDDLKAGRVYEWKDVKKELGWISRSNVQAKTHKSGKKRT